MPAITTSIQHLTGALVSPNGQKMKYLKIGMEKNIPVFAGVMIVLTVCPEALQILELIRKMAKLQK